MTEKLASHIAGLKLGGIVAVLLIPMLILSYFMMQSLRREIAFTEREIDGAALIRLVHPIIISAYQGSIADADLQRLRDDGTPLADRLGVQKDMSGTLATLYTMGSDKRFALLPLQRLLARVARQSNLLSDPDPETYALGAIAGVHAPDVLTDFVAAWTAQARALGDGALDSHEITSILMALGSWRDSQQHLSESYAVARAAAADPAAYAAASEIAAEMMSHPLAVARVFSRAAPSELATKLAAVPEFSGAATHIGKDADQLWTDARTRLDVLLGGRLHELQVQLTLMLAMAAAVCLLGSGAAALMFRNTLRQLDTVQAAREQAERARAEAQASAAQLTRISDDVTRLNIDLSNNLRMLREAQDDNLRKGKLAHLGQLTATVAHELRNPLGAVRTSAFLLERRLKDKGLGIEAQLERINNGVMRCDNIISQLLDFARTKPLQVETLDIDSWLERLIQDEAERLPKAVTVECRLGTGGVSAPFDPARMSRVLINLLNNASEAMVGKGDEPERFSTPRPRIIIETQVTARGIEITVGDNGPGIAAEVLDRIFEPLFTTKSFGTGLGLPAVQKILEQHDGGLEVSSQPGQGTTFTAWWPLAAALKEAV